MNELAFFLTKEKKWIWKKIKNQTATTKSGREHNWDCFLKKHKKLPQPKQNSSLRSLHF